MKSDDGISDAEVVERSKYDLRWKVALDLDPLTCVAPFAKATFQAFRLRLTLHEKEGLAFEKSVRAAVEAGLIEKTLKVALDSSPVRGRGAVKDTFNLLSDAIRVAVRAIAKQKECEPEAAATTLGVERHFTASSVKGDAEVRWDDPISVGQFLAGLVEDCDTVVKAAKRAGCTAEIELLRKVLDQDVDRSGELPVIKREVAPGRTVSVHDSDMRHGRKSSGKTFTGHKAHVAVDTVSGVVTAVEVTAPGVQDGSRLESLVDETERRTGAEVQRVVGDSAYSTRETAEQAETAGVELVTKMPGPQKGYFSPGRFKVSPDRLEARCPAGFQSVNVWRRRTNDSVTHKWAPEACAACPLRGQCIRKDADRRTLVVAPDFRGRRSKERFAKTKKGRAILRTRVVAEHAIGRLKNLGAGSARWFGRAKTRVQWLWAAAILNLRIVWAESPMVPAHA